MSSSKKVAGLKLSYLGYYNTMPTILSKNKIIINKNTSKNDLLSILLKNRGLKTADVVDFFNPPHPKTLTPKNFGVNSIHLKRAIKLINQTVADNKNILIYGDYDVDGITSTTLMWQALFSINAKVLPFIPDRLRDGYGFKYNSLIAFETKKNTHFDLIITVDNGIVAHHDLAKLIKEGRQVIVVDHHLPDKTLDKKILTIHSTQVSGSILSWLVASKISNQADLGLAALGAVADCVPLLGINRSVVFHGLLSLRLNPSIGLRKLIEVSNIKQDSLTTYDLGYIIGPRINAVGRLSDPTDALRLLCSTSLSQATKYAAVLNGYNKDRQQLQSDHLDEAYGLVKNNHHKIIIISSKNFSAGIIGLVAGRLLEKYYLPSIVISIDGDLAKGSCRSISELNIIDELRIYSSLFEDLGGHSMAAGFTIRTKNIPIFKKKFTKHLNAKLVKVDLQPTIQVDAQMDLSAVNLKNCQLLQKLEPFGVGNPEPLFIFKSLKIISKRLLGANGDHLKLTLEKNVPARLNVSTFGVDAIAFKKGDLDKTINVGDSVNLVAQLEINHWQGRSTPQLIVKEIFQ